MNLTLKQINIADLITSHFDYTSKINAIRFIKDICGSTFDLRDTVIAYNSLGW